MKKIIITLALIIIATHLSVAQNDNILKPVDIHPPRPGGQPQKKDNDEQLASQYYRRGEYDKAVILYGKLFKDNGNSIYYHYYLSCLLKLEDYKEAEKLTKSQMRKFPDAPKYAIDLGFVMSQEGNSQKAKKQYDKVIKELRPNLNMIKEVANAFLIRGETEYAINTFKRGKQLVENYSFALELGNLYRQTGNYSGMIAEYLDYIDSNPSNFTYIQYRLQDVLDKDEEGEIAAKLRRELLKRIQKAPGKVYFSEMLYWLSVQEKNFDLAFTQAKAIDKRTGGEGDLVMELAGLSLSNGDYDVAIEAYEYVIKKGKDNIFYLEARIGVINARYQKITDSFDYSKKDLEELEKEYLSVLDDYGENASTVQVMRYLGHLQAFFLDKTDEAIDILNQAIEIQNADPADIADCKIELADILLFAGNVWDAKLLYSQVEKEFKNDPVGHLAKFKNAKLSFYIGQFDWAKAQLDVLKAATSKFIANDALQLSVLISDNIDMDSSTVALSMYAKADLLLYRNHDREALTVLDSIFSIYKFHPIFDEVLYKKAEIMIKEGKYEKAAGFLEEIANKYPQDITADDALFLLGKLYEKQLNDKEKAMKYYRKLMMDYPASVYTSRARKHFRYLRGDFDSEETPLDDDIFLENKL